MKLPSSVLSLASVALLAASGCSSDIVAPRATEPLSVSVQTRAAAQGEVVPSIRATPGAGRFDLRVVSAAGNICAPIVDAKISRTPGHIDIVSAVSANPAALCATGDVTGVVEYSGTVGSVSAGAYVIRVFERRGDGDAKLIGTSSVVVGSP